MKIGKDSPAMIYLESYYKTMDKEIKVPVTSRLPQDIIDRWYLFALQTRQTKEEALAKIIIKGTPNKKSK